MTTYRRLGAILLYSTKFSKCTFFTFLVQLFSAHNISKDEISTTNNGRVHFSYLYFMLMLFSCKYSIQVFSTEQLIAIILYMTDTGVQYQLCEILLISVNVFQCNNPVYASTVLGIRTGFLFHALFSHSHLRYATVNTTRTYRRLYKVYIGQI